MEQRNFTLDEILEDFADGSLQTIITGTKRKQAWDFQPYFGGKEELTADQFRKRLPDIGDVLTILVFYPLGIGGKSVTFERVELEDGYTYRHTAGELIE